MSKVVSIACSIAMVDIFVTDGHSFDLLLSLHHRKELFLIQEVAKLVS